jgi:two-component system, NtrC family, response regulator
MSPQNGHILIVDDERNLCRILSKVLESAGYETFTALSADEALGTLELETIDAVISDVRMPGMDGVELLQSIKAKEPDVAVIMMTAYPSIEGAVRAMNAGAYNYITKPFNNDEVLLTVRRAMEHRNLLERNRYLSRELESRFGLENMIGSSPAMQHVIDLIKKVAPTESTVLLLGESGTGKDVAARAIHQISSRRDRNFVPINCGALPRDLLESELFGYEKGAFTDARSTKKGLVEEAAGGTLFLDEIADLPPELQTKILRLLESKEYRRLGGTQTKKADIRIITATNRNLTEEMAADRFREDLYYRLKTLEILLPPLRERKEDIPLLVEHFIEKLNHSLGRRTSGVSQRAMKGLLRYEWPGNVRQLQKAVERAMILSESPILDFTEFGLPQQLVSSSKESRDEDGQWDQATALPYKKAKEIFERQYFENLLKLNENNVTKSAISSGLSRRHLQEKIKQLHIRRPTQDTGSDEDED